MRSFFHRLFLTLASFSILNACGSPSEPRHQPQPPALATSRTIAPATPFPEVKRASLIPASAASQGYAGHPAARAFIQRMAREEQFDPEEVARILAQAQRQSWILDFMNRPKGGKTGPTGAWTRYRARFLTAANIANGSKFWHRYDEALERAHRRYGVPPEYVVAILGVETRYGSYLGKHRVLDALATLAFDFPPRSAFFTDELAAFLVMARNEGLDPRQPRGSYAGAMGYGQFMPSSFHRWAVDFDGDGRRDLWNPVDAIGSVANYFAEHGWRTDEPVAIRTRVQGAGIGSLKTGYDTAYRLSELRDRGIQPLESVPPGTRVSLIRLDAADGYEYWLGFQNFYVITRYNHSSYYAMAVHQLAQRVRARHALKAGSRLSRSLPDTLGQAL